ncbi:MAG: hypothetical protein AAFV53_28970 [Myxococcota bacterium]
MNRLILLYVVCPLSVLVVGCSVPDDPGDPAEDIADPDMRDSDHDGLSDLLEKRLGTDPNNPDTDNDGLNDGIEHKTYGTDPLREDSDGDGVTDYAEVNGDSDPLDDRDWPSPVGINQVTYCNITTEHKFPLAEAAHFLDDLGGPLPEYYYDTDTPTECRCQVEIDDFSRVTGISVFIESEHFVETGWELKTADTFYTEYPYPYLNPVPQGVHVDVPWHGGLSYQSTELENAEYPGTAPQADLNTYHWTAFGRNAMDGDEAAQSMETNLTGIYDIFVTVKNQKDRYINRDNVTGGIYSGDADRCRRMTDELRFRVDLNIAQLLEDEILMTFDPNRFHGIRDINDRASEYSRCESGVQGLSHLSLTRAQKGLDAVPVLLNGSNHYSGAVIGGIEVVSWRGVDELTITAPDGTTYTLTPDNEYLLFDSASASLPLQDVQWSSTSSLDALIPLDPVIAVHHVCPTTSVEIATPNRAAYKLTWGMIDSVLQSASGGAVDLDMVGPRNRDPYANAFAIRPPTQEEPELRIESTGLGTLLDIPAVPVGGDRWAGSYAYGLLSAEAEVWEFNDQLHATIAPISILGIPFNTISISLESY